jgi:hypothetical protein
MALAGCGKAHPSKTAIEGCLDGASDRGVASVFEAAYKAGKLGSAAHVRLQIAKLGPFPGITKQSFLHGDGTLARWDAMNYRQKQTFMAWAHGPASTTSLEVAATAASNRAVTAARRACSS